MNPWSTRLIFLCAVFLLGPAYAEQLTVVYMDTAPVATNGGVGEYVVTIRFINDAVESDHNPYVTVELPPGARYVAGSATGPGATAKTMNEIRDVSSLAPAQATDSPEPPSDAVVSSIRWDLPGPMDPGVRGIVSFRFVQEEVPVAEDDRPDPGPDGRPD
ncbi:MAG: hypothetical protein JSW21_11255 [Gammaproteobacteria bacterium]|nr:MAG: hypothetical protein JSW21_11255 [Gammaproteobacteria bacterium]